MNILPRFSRTRTSGEEYENELIRFESKIGGQLFGQVPKGHTRQFFCLDEHTWVWHEQWQDKSGQNQSMTTKYYVRPSGIIKSQNGGTYSQVTDKEAKNLIKAAKIYVSRAKNEYSKHLNPAV
jgi:hypothetical protein